MRAFLGRTAFYWQPFLITVIGLSLLALWSANLSPGYYGLPTGEFWGWLGITLFIGLPGMGTLCALVGAQAQQVGWAGVTGLAGLIVSSLVAALLGGNAESVPEVVTGAASLAIFASVPFLVGFGAGRMASRPPVPRVEPDSTAAAPPTWKVLRCGLLHGAAPGDEVIVGVEADAVIVARRLDHGVQRLATYPVGVRLRQAEGDAYQLTYGSSEIALLTPIDADPTALAAQLGDAAP